MVTTTSEASEGAPFAIDFGGLTFARIAYDARLLDMCVEGALGAKKIGVRQRSSESLPIAEKMLITRLSEDLKIAFATAIATATGKTLSMDPAEKEALRGHRKVFRARYTFESDGARSMFFPSTFRVTLRDQQEREEVEGEPVHLNESMQAVVPDIDVAIIAELGRAKVGLSRLLNLRVGETLRLTAATDDPVLVRVGGVEKFQGVPIISRGQVGVGVQSRRVGRRS